MRKCSEFSRALLILMSFAAPGTTYARAQPASEQCEGDLTKIDGMTFPYPVETRRGTRASDNRLVFRFTGTAPCTDGDCRLSLIDADHGAELAHLKITASLFESFHKLCEKKEAERDESNPGGRHCRGRVDRRRIRLVFRQFHVDFRQELFGRTNIPGKISDCRESYHADIRGASQSSFDFAITKRGLLKITMHVDARMRPEPELFIAERRMIQD